MDSDEAAVIEDYESSLEDLTFNSKPLINVLTMLAEENREHAVVIVKLIQQRINKVEQLQKLPALYLLDSIIKNVGGEYLNLIAQVIDSVFTAVFEKADEKTRRDLHKLRNTWPQYFSARKLYELDVKVKKLDPAWPISSVPPPSPTIHINPKFLKKVEEVGPTSPVEGTGRQDSVVIHEHQNRLLQLQKLQDEQLALTEREIEEHKLKRELLLKKQMQERQLLLKQQQEQMLKLRLLADQKGTSSDSDTENSSVPSPMEVSEAPSDSSFAVPQSVSAVGKGTNTVQQYSVIRDPRLRKNGQQMVNDKGKDSEEEMKNPRIQVVSDTHRRSPVQIDNQMPQAEKAKELIEPKFESEHLKLKSADERGLQLDYNHGRHDSAKGLRNSGVDRRETNNKSLGRRDSRSKDMNRRKRDERKRGRGRGFNRGGREQRDETWQDRNAQRCDRMQDKKDTKRDFPINDHSRLLTEEPLMKKPKPLFEDHEILEIRAHSAASPRRDLPTLKDIPENSESNIVQRDRFDSRPFGHGQPPHHHGRLSPPHPVSLGIRPGHKIDMLPHRHEPPPHEGHWHGNPDQQRSRPTFEIPQELTLDHKSEILSQAERRLSTGDISKEQHRDLVEKLEQFYELQRQQEQFQRLNFERQLGPEHHPDEYVRPQETFRHGEPRMAVPHMIPGEPGVNEVPSSLPLRPGWPIDRDGPIHPVDHSRPFPPNEHRGPFRPFDDHHPNFTADQQGPPGPMGRLGPGEFRSQGSDFPVELDDHGHIRPFEGSHQHFDQPGRVHSINKQGPNQNFSRGMDQPRQHMDQQHFHPLDHERMFGPGLDHMRHGLPEEALQREPVSHGWPSRQPEHWQGEPGRLLGPMQDRGRSSPSMDMDVPRGELLRNPDMAGPGFRADMRGAPPMDQMRHQEMVLSSMGQVRASQFEPGPAEQNLKSHEEPRTNVVMPQTPPRDQSVSNTGTPFTPNTMLEKKSVDDLFQRLVSVGIIRVMPEQVQEPQTRSATPPQAPLIIPQSKPDEKIPDTKTKEETKIPEIKLIPTELKKRHESIINRLCSGTQCSSCGLRFPGKGAVKYREHLDWHFRMNRREKDGRRVAHRQWYITFKDWLSYEEISDPEERAHSSVFEILKGTATSDSPETTSATENNSNSTPVLDGDGETESTCDICCEKFEQFWEESAEEWHYRDAVRVDGKTYHNLCYQDAKESHIEADEEEQEDSSAQSDNKDAPDNITTSSEEKPLNKNTEDDRGGKGEKDAVKDESSISKDSVEKITEKFSSEECKTLEKEVEIDSIASGKVVANKDENGQNDK